MKTTLIAVLTSLALIACSEPTSGGGEGQPTATPIGSPAVYATIAAESDCATLQAGFDRAETNGNRDRARGEIGLAMITTEYMKAYDARMRAVGCYR